MKRVKVEYGSEWKYEWHQYYRCINIFQIYFHNDGGSKGISFFFLNLWIAFKIIHKDHKTTTE